MLGQLGPGHNQPNVYFFSLRESVLCFARMVGRTWRGVLIPVYLEPCNFPSFSTLRNIYIKRKRCGCRSCSGLLRADNEGQGFVVWEEGSIRPVVLIFYSHCQGFKQKNSLDLVSRDGPNPFLEKPFRD